MEIAFIKRIATGFFLAALILTHGIARAEENTEDSGSDIINLSDDDKKEDANATKQEEKKIDFSFHGYVTLNFAARDQEKKFNKDIHYIKVGPIVQLQFEGNAYDRAHFYSATNIELNMINEDNPNEMNYKPFIKMIETYVDLYPTKWFTIRAGHQLITWGEIEGMEAPTDIVCPWDYSIKTTVFEEYKLGVTALALNFFFFKQKFEFVWMPVFQPAIIPREEIDRKSNDFRRYIAEIPIVNVIRPSKGIGNTEFAARISGSIDTNFRYAAAILYGFDDLPDTKLTYDVITDSSLPGLYYANLTKVRADLFYNRILIPTLDFAYDVMDLFSLKASTAFYKTKDFAGKRDELKNSTVKYLFGAESTNIGFDIYFALYVGQMWVINYTPVHTGGWYETTYNIVSNRPMLDGFDQEYKYKWLLSNILQRNFLANSALEVSLRYALSIDPKFKNVDYTINCNIMYKFTNGVSTTIGFIFADKIGVIQNIGILEIKYSF